MDSTAQNVFDTSFVKANGSRRGSNSRNLSGQAPEQRRVLNTPPTPSRSFLNGPIAQAIGSPAHRSPSSNNNRNRSASQPNDVISLRSMDGALNNGRHKSISFCGMSMVIDSVRKFSSDLVDKKNLEGLRIAVAHSDIRTIQRLCSTIPWAALAASEEAIQQSNASVLSSILELCVNSESEFLKTNGVHLLSYSAQFENSLDCSRLLLEMGISPNEKTRSDQSDESPMHSAAKEGNQVCLEMMHLEFDGDLNLGSNFDGGSLLHAAVRSNSLGTVRYLLKNGVDVTSKSKYSNTALHVAAENNFFECAELLLEFGALVDALRGESERETALLLAANNGYCKMVKLLLFKGANPLAEKGNGETPLHLACKCLCDIVIKMLIHSGANVNAQDREGRPPLHCVINSKLKGGTNCIQILLDNGADVNLVDNIGTTALHLAAVNNSMTRISILIENGADLCAQNKAGKSAFYTALKHAPNSIRAIEKRLDKGLILENPGSDSGPIIKMDFMAIVPRSPKNDLSFISEVGLFSEVLNFQQNDPSHVERLLMHPLAEGYLQLKWSQIKWLYYLLMLLTHLIYSITYSVYAVLVFKNLCTPELKDNIYSNVTCAFNYNVNTTNPNVEVGHKAKVICAQLAWIFLIIFTVMYVVKESTKLAHLRQRYIWTLEAWLNFLVIISVLLITFYVSPFDLDHVTVYRWQYHACGYGVFITWLLQMFLIGKVPRFGKYVEMFKNVSKTFINFFIAYIFLFVSFAVSFFILFPTHAAFNEVLPAALVKVLVMMLGELEYDDLYYPQKQTLNMSLQETYGYGEIVQETQQQFFPFTAHILVTVFILLVSIIIMNLLFGLAVTDIQELYKVARLHQLIQQVELINYMENLLFSPIFRFFPRILQDQLRRTLQGLQTKGGGGYPYIKILNTSDHSDRSLSVNLKKKIVDYTLKSSNQNPDKSRLEQEVDEIRRQLTSMESLLKEVLGQQRVALSYSRASTVREDSVFSDSDDVTDSTVNRRTRNRDLESGGGLTLSSSLGRICEESPQGPSTSRSTQNF